MSEQGNFPQQRQNRPESEIVRKFLDNQEKEIEVKRREVEISAIQDGNQKEVALASIAAQKDDLSNERQYSFKAKVLNKIFVVVLVLISASFLIFALSNGHSQLAIEMIKIAGTAIISGLGGYYYGKSAVGKSDKSKDQLE